MAEGALKTIRILVIEDDPAVAQALVDGLEREGMQVTWRNNGESGYQWALKMKPHLLLLDVRLPDSSGFDVCHRFRQNGLRLPIILLTVQRDEVDKVLGLEMGADDYVTKPFSLRELLSRIRAQLRRAYGEYANSNASLLFAGDLTIDLGKGQVLAGEKVIPLTPIEFRILAYLARNRGQAITRQLIVEEVWGSGGDIDIERSINVHIRRIREKVENDPARPTLILTVPGIGYRLVG